MTLDEAAWAEVERLYVEGVETVDAIAARFGITARKIYARIEARELPRRSPRSAANAGRTAAAKPAHTGDATKAARDILITRLYRALSKKIKHLEDRMDTTDGTDPQISEQQTRELNAAVSAFEKVTEVHTDADKARSAALSQPVATRADLERLRRELAERLHRAWSQPKR